MILRSILILIGLILFGNLVPLIPDYVYGEWSSFGVAGGDVFIVIFGLIPIILFVLLDLDIINVYSLPFSDILDDGVKGVLYASVLITSLVYSSGPASALSNAISIILTLFVVIFPFYLFYDYIVRDVLRVKNRFFYRYLPSLVIAGAFVLPIALAYVLAQFGVYLPGDLMLVFGTQSFFDGTLIVPTLYLVSLGGCVVYFVYYVIIRQIIGAFMPKPDYKYAKESEYVVCKNCQFYLGGRCQLGFTDLTIGSNGVICYDYKRKN